MKQNNSLAFSSKDFDDVINILTEQMIKDNFQNKMTGQDKFIITKQDLYEFSIKLVKTIRGVYSE